MRFALSMIDLGTTATWEVVHPGLIGGSSLRIPMSFDDFVALGEAKHHEWYDGMCIVNPPAGPHVLAAKRLATILDRHVPQGLLAVQEGGWRTGAGLFQPDLMVVQATALRERVAEQPPLFIVEILSPSTCTEDRIVKRAKYGAEGLAWYWIVDLDALTLEVLRNDDRDLIEVQTIRAGEAAETVGPFPVPIDPADLTR